ncbi:MAG: DUF86 domain-containing protein [Clostridia bacterium]|nr:DUF86 domain-containing protein [Clostridia bacterium]
MKQTDAERLETIIRLWDELSVQLKMHGISPDMLLNDRYTQWAVTTPLYNIGEQVYQLNTEFKEHYSGIPWNVVSGLRHRLVHNYEGINWSIIVEIVFHEMDVFINRIKEIVNTEAVS